MSELRAPFGDFGTVLAASEAWEGLAPPVLEALKGWDAAESVLYVDTDPEKADTAVFCEAYRVPLELSANCVVVAAKRGGEVTYAACLVRADRRLDVNGVVRKHLGARKASFAPMEEAVARTGMEYGGITVVGLPPEWPLLVDEAVVALPQVLIGSGRRRGKLILPGAAVAGLPRAEVLVGLAA
ncbi:YbaK/EbsC family protein [Kitasatospora sp. NPDC001664]|uniref:YbaK/EbsC family protein n=1 Tax=Kitasatospora albolonga TaxID=68173 RepID=UPI0035EEAACA